MRLAGRVAGPVHDVRRWSWEEVRARRLARHRLDRPSEGGPADVAAATCGAHHGYLAALDPDRPPAEQAAAIVDRAISAVADRRGGRPTVAFEVLAGPGAG